jgi:hypothetical protein
MDNETFEITLTKYRLPKRKFRMQVEIFHRSEQVIRFKIYVGKKFIIMEKLLMKHKGQWKIKEMNFEMSGDIKDNSQSIVNIQDEIDYYLDGRPKPFNKYANK